MTSKGFKYTTEVLSSLFIDFTRFINLSISPSLKIQILCSSLSHSIFEKKNKNKNDQIMSFFESLGDSIGEGFADASPWNFVSNKAHQGAFFLLLLLFIIRMYSSLYSLFISTSEIFTEKFPTKYHCILYLSFNVVNDSRNIWVIQKFKLPLKFCPQNFLA